MGEGARVRGGVREDDRGEQEREEGRRSLSLRPPCLIAPNATNP